MYDYVYYVGLLLLLVGLGYAFRWSNERLAEAASWGRWDEVLRRMWPFHRFLPWTTVVERRARALAGLGRVDEAVDVVRRHAQKKGLENWEHQMVLARMYRAANLHDPALECLRRAYADIPENPRVRLELAKTLYESRADLALARQLVEDLDKEGPEAFVAWEARLTDEQTEPAKDETGSSENLVDYFDDVARSLAVPHIYHVKGLAALADEDFGAAVEQFQAAETVFKDHASDGELAIVVAENRAYLAIALAELGRVAEAEETFALARPRLEAMKEERLLNRWKQAIGQA